MTKHFIKAYFDHWEEINWGFFWLTFRMFLIALIKLLFAKLCCYRAPPETVKIISSYITSRKKKPAHLIYPRYYWAKLTTMFFMQSRVFKNGYIKRKVWEVFFTEEVRFFPEKNIFATLQIDWKTVPVDRFSVIWKTSAFSQLWKLTFFLWEKCAPEYRSFVTNSCNNWCQHLWVLR